VTVPGNVVELADGSHWLIPRGVAFNGTTIGESLPRMIDVDETGQWIIGDVQPKFTELWEATKIVYDAWIGALATSEQESNEGQRTVSMTLEDELDFVELCLQTNYRVSRFEMGMLGLLDRETPSVVLLALIDWPTYLDAIKKKTLPG
jgi:hypothetical protein